MRHVRSFNPIAAPLTGPVELTDGVIDFSLLLGQADRHSLRIHTKGNAESYRIVLSRNRLEVALNPASGDPSNKATTLGSLRMRFRPSLWQPMRLTFAGDVLTVQSAGSELKVKHPVFAKPKEQLNFIAFEGEVGIQQVQTSSQSADGSN